MFNLEIIKFILLLNFLHNPPRVAYATCGLIVVIYFWNIEFEINEGVICCKFLKKIIKRFLNYRELWSH